MNPHDHSLDDVAVFALGSLAAPQAQAMRAQIATCRECMAEYRALRPAADLVGLTAESAAQPSRLLKARLMKHVRTEAAPSAGAIAPSAATVRAVRPIVWPAYAVAAACLVIALLMGGINSSLTSSLKQSQNEVEATSVRSSTLARAVESQKQTIADLINTGSQHFQVADGEVIRHGARLYIAMRDLPAPPKGKVYQAWTQKTGAKGMSPSVTFVPNRNGVAVVALPENGTQVAAVALSVEPEGGSKQPTSAPTFLVKLS